MGCKPFKIFRFLAPVILMALLPLGCAWENVAPGEGATNRIWEIRMVMEEAVNTSMYYYIVFNFTGDPVKIPVATFDGLDRGQYWDLYYLYGRPGDYPDGPNLKPLDFYQGEGGTQTTGGELPVDTDPQKRRKDPQKPASTQNKLDILPELLTNQPEYLTATITSSPIIDGGPPIANNTIYLRLNFRSFPKFPSIVNMNMIISSLGIDLLSNDPNDDYDALVWDSFEGKGISLNIDQHDDFREGEGFTVEVTDAFVPGRPPSANIVSWSVTIKDV